MPRAVLVTVSLLLAAAPARAVMTPSVAALGWTNDSTAFVWMTAFEAPESWTVVPAVGGKAVVLTKQAEFDAFVREHPLPEELPAATAVAPGGKARVQGNGLVADDGTFVLKKAASLTLERGGVTSATESFARGTTVSVHWSPDGRRVALFAQEEEVCTPSGGDYACNDPRRYVVMLPVSGPRVQLLGKGLEPDVFARVAGALDKAGFAVTDHDTAQVARDKSVVYAPKALADAARAIAAAVPGGATVDVLSWKTRFDVVVALGGSAR